MTSAPRFQNKKCWDTKQKEDKPLCVIHTNAQTVVIVTLGAYVRWVACTQNEVYPVSVTRGGRSGLTRPWGE